MILIVSLLLIVIVFYYRATNNLNYWSKRKVKHDKPLPLLGNHLANIMCKKSITTVYTEFYNKFPNEKLVGYYKGTVPELIIKDPELIKHIMCVDFDHFHARGLFYKSNPLLLNPIFADGDMWKLLRQSLTPAFNTAKLKAMFPLVVQCAEKLQNCIEQRLEFGDVHDARELTAGFTTEFIGACGFGINMDTINNQRSQFRELGKLIFARPMKVRILFALTEIFPELLKIINVGDHPVEDSMTVIVNKIREQRNYKPSSRNDFIDLLLELESKGKIVGESMEKRTLNGAPAQVEIPMDIKLIVAQVFIFFAAGFETSATATSYTLHELAFHPESQTKIQLEIDEVLSRYNNKLCYEAIAEMSYLNMAFKEAMRIFPSVGTLKRKCTKKYTFPGTNVTIDPGVKVVLPAQAIHMDEKYFDNPTEFRPERFLPEAVQERHQFVYIPFGKGPRHCIGMRLGQMQSLAGLAAILQKFTVLPAPSTRREITLDHKVNFVQSVKGELPIMLKLRKAKSV